MSPEHKVKEDEWFHKNEKELLRKAREERERREKEMAAAMKEEEAKKLKKLHWMKCPKCGSDMVEKSIEHVDVDICTLCEGVFFDRGEMEDYLLKQHREPTSFMKKLLGWKK